MELLSPPEPAACWQCGADSGGNTFCPECRALQPPQSDYFRVFGLERRLAVDTAGLQRRFYDLSRQLHPDRYQRKSPAERQYSLDNTALLNDAYRVLRDPVERAEYVLKQEGFNIGEQRTQDVPPELLEEVFELNMALEEIRGGDPSCRPQLERARDRFVAMRNEIETSLEQLFAEFDARQDRTILGSLRGVLNKRRYIRNLIRDVEKELA